MKYTARYYDINIGKTVERKCECFSYCERLKQFSFFTDEPPYEFIHINSATMDIRCGIDGVVIEVNGYQLIPFTGKYCELSLTIRIEED